MAAQPRQNTAGAAKWPSTSSRSHIQPQTRAYRSRSSALVTAEALGGVGGGESGEAGTKASIPFFQYRTSDFVYELRRGGEGRAGGNGVGGEGVGGS